MSIELQEMNNQYENILRDKISKFGDMSIGALIVRLHFLAHLIKTSQFHEATMNQVLQKVIEQYYYENLPLSSLQQYITIEKDEKNAGEVYVFDEDYFQKNYCNALPDASFNIKNISSRKDISLLEDSLWYIYTVNQENELVIYNSPMTVSELVLNRNSTTINNVQIVHPILVHNKDLKVRTAGEICFVKNGDLLKGIILNTKSGHYRPDPFSYKVTEEILISKFDLKPDEIIKIPVGLNKNNNTSSL